MKNIEVVAAIFTNENNEVFCARRKDEGELALKWEFPGGKIEPGESHQEALIREIKEELSTDIKVKDFIMTVRHQYNSFHLTMHAYFAEVVNGNLVLNEHTGFKWLRKEELYSLDWAAADLPIVDFLAK
ncbi:MAG: 8-oxo-dGTP diphosphatase MutT [Tenericutes bacterium HGW-Tenericutes-5]|jgi:8-oxo-dGTP diphosphatase|nr:MAG: 8-oxo-dGTP diphosphatase MutT [Tenericutes bacterium HGW-Tenericutes-5]